jgi:GNAT superfamily N-acetyltransferase
MPEARLGSAVTWTVRAATPADADELVASTLGNALDSEGLRLDPARARAGVEAILADPGRGRFFVAADAAGRVAGSCYVTFEWSYWHAAWYWWVQSVHVRSPLRRQGVYRALHAAVLEQARREGVRSVRLYVERANGAAIAAYAALGMERTPYEVWESVLHPAPPQG